MIAVDAGVLARGINRFVPEHARAAAVLEALANGDAPWALPWPAVHAFVRQVTHPHAVARPLAPGDAWGFVSQLLESPSVRALGPGPRHGAAIAEVLAMLPAGAAPPSLELAAVLREHNVREVLTTDRALRVYPFLLARDPLHDGTSAAAAVRPAARYRRLTPRRP